MSAGQTPSDRWIPSIAGTEVQTLLGQISHLSPSSRQKVLQEAQGILGKCVSPIEPSGQVTGLAIGYVQSGKTLNFTTVTALARDNAYPIVIIITGTSKNLFHQSTQRLLRDLRIGMRNDRKWRHFPNPTTKDVDAFQGLIENWRSNSVPDTRRPAIIATVMKHHRHLAKLNDLLDMLDLVGIPALIIDDEADQAGLNNEVRMGSQSETYSRLLTLKSRLPHHTFLQYTATPQAPLLINIIDALSPSFVEILQPGLDYVGGSDFFVAQPRLVRTIPSREIPTKKNPITRAPTSLLEAMRLFIVGVAAGIHIDNAAGNRSMLVHPSRPTAPHGNYVDWICRVKRQWERKLLNESSSLPSELEAHLKLMQSFRDAYDDLATTLPNLVNEAPFSAVQSLLLEAVRNTEVVEVNTRMGGATPNIFWQNTYSHILVGGQAMDRGFTVEGLTVTYMPRALGIGNADTVQQRARFFGYKRSYLGFCRVFLEQATIRAYQEYVRHEEDIRGRMIVHRNSGASLSEWKRGFFLSPNLRPTRDNLIDVPYIHGTIGDDWFFPRGPQVSPDAVIANREVVKLFVDALTFTPDGGHKDRTNSQRHLIAEPVLLKDVYARLLTPLRIAKLRDSLRFYGVLLQIKAFLEENSAANCTVYRMSPGEVRDRSVNTENDMRTLQQGPYKIVRGGSSVEIYPGDYHIKHPTDVTIQIFSLRMFTDERRLIDNDIPVVAVWIPSEISKPFLVQDQA